VVYGRSVVYRRPVVVHRNGHRVVHHRPR
jgi:hypothetical protein